MTETGTTGSAAAVRPIASITASRARARDTKGPAATCSEVRRNSDEGGTSRRAINPSSTSPGSTRETWATLTPDRRARVRMLSSVVVSASTERIRPCTPGITASTGWMKSMPAGYELPLMNGTIVSSMI